jgi:hypothetical protein
MGVGPGTLTNSRDLPGNLDAGLAGADSGAIIVDLLRDDGLGELPDHGQLMAEVTVQCTEVIRKRHVAGRELRWW